MGNEQLTVTPIYEWLLHEEKYEWGKATDKCLAAVTVGRMREILAEVKRLREYEWMYKDLCDER